MTRPPLKRVAALAQVSEPTVSRVLNGREGVSQRTRDRVTAALRELGFDAVPEPRPERRNVVGLVCGDFLNPVFSTFVHHLASDLGRAGFVTSLAMSDPDLVPEERCVAELTRAGVDAIVFIHGRHAEISGDLAHYEALVAGGTPVVLINGADTGLAVPHIRCDEGAGARKAVDHLADLGHTQIGCLLGSPNYIPTIRFIDGYRDTLARRGLDEPHGAIIETAFTLEGGRAGATRLLDRGVTAMIAGNDLMALGAVLAARTRGGSVSVVGYDGTEMTTLTDPPLTTLRQPFEDMAQLATTALLSELDGNHSYRDHYVFEPQLLARNSTHALRTTAAVAGS